MESCGDLGVTAAAKIKARVGNKQKQTNASGKISTIGRHIPPRHSHFGTLLPNKTTPTPLSRSGTYDRAAPDT